MTTHRAGECFKQAPSLAIQRLLMIGAWALVLSACEGSVEATSLSYAENSPEVPEAPSPPVIEDAWSEPDVTTAADAGVIDASGADSGIQGDIAEPRTISETQGNTIITDPSSFDGVFLYGLGISPYSPLSYIGNTPAGTLAIPTVIEFTEDLFQIRVYDMDAGAMLDGNEGLIESYPYTLKDDGRIQIDFSTPETVIEIQQWNNCVYRQDDYQIGQPPLFADRLLTWGALETYNPHQCGQWGLPPSQGFNVHFLRRLNANPDFQSRTAEQGSAFLFFKVGDDLLTRIPYIGAEFTNGAIVYELTSNFPEHLKDEVELVLEDWNDALEEAAGNRPFRLSKNHTLALVPWDPRARVISWGGENDFDGAIAPFVSDPLSGETFDGDVILWMTQLDSIIASYQEFINKNPDYPGLGTQSMAFDLPQREFRGPLPAPRSDSDAQDLPKRVLRRQVFQRRPLNPLVLHQLFSNIEMTLTVEGLESYILRDFLTHEIGHNLGLRHNFRASMDKDHKAPEVSSSSCMDYVVGLPAPGSYDIEAMRYGYGEGPLVESFLSCTDGQVEIDPACARWDFGHPVRFFLEVLDKKETQIPPDTPDQNVEYEWEAQEWNKLFNRVRQFLNTEHELWAPDDPVSVFEVLLDRVMCPGECTIHTRFRRWYALYLLYTRFAFEQEWYEFPTLNDDQVTTLWTSFTDLIFDPSQPTVLKKTILQKLPTSSVPGANDTLNAITQQLSSMADPSTEEQELLGFINDL